jgi:hypothetical protein
MTIDPECLIRSIKWSIASRHCWTAELFHAGTLCGSHLLQAQGGTGQLHLIRRGPITVVHGSTRQQIDRPSLLLYPRPMAHPKAIQ